MNDAETDMTFIIKRKINNGRLKGKMNK